MELSKEYHEEDIKIKITANFEKERIARENINTILTKFAAISHSYYLDLADELIKDPQ